MTQPASEVGALPVFNHATRKEWGVAILVREESGKRAYLFEDGKQRTVADGFYQLMHQVEQPTGAQRAFYERHQALLARRASASASRLGHGNVFDQIEKLHQTYPAGLADPQWVLDVRGQGAAGRVARHRDPLIREAQEQLSPAALDALMKTQSYARVWELVTAILSRTDLVPSTQLKKPLSASHEGLRSLAFTVRDLLHGEGPYEPRFDRYLAALSSVYGEAPRWEIATALSAAFHPSDHVCVHPAAFRQQLKVMGTRVSAPARATTAGYTRFLHLARLVSKKLGEQGESPRDLFDVYDFIRSTLAPSTSTRKRGKA